MHTALTARREALLGSRTVSQLLDDLDLIEKGPRTVHGHLATEEHRMVRAWIIDEIESRHPEVVEWIEERMEELPDDDAMPYNAHLRDALVVHGVVKGSGRYRIA